MLSPDCNVGTSTEYVCMWHGSLRRSITKRREKKGKGNAKSKRMREKEEKEEEEVVNRLPSSFVLSCAKKISSTLRPFNDYPARWGVCPSLPPWLWRE